MGDYTLCNLHFSLKEETPQDKLEIIRSKLKYNLCILPEFLSLSNFRPCSSAYHHIESFSEIESMRDPYTEGFECLRFNTIFQLKYGRGLDEFIEYIKPWVIIDDQNRGCIGWTLSEYCSIPTFLFIKNEFQDPKDLYILDLENKLHNLLKGKN